MVTITRTDLPLSTFMNLPCLEASGQVGLQHALEEALRGWPAACRARAGRRSPDGRPRASHRARLAESGSSGCTLSKPSCSTGSNAMLAVRNSCASLAPRLRAAPVGFSQRLAEGADAGVSDQDDDACHAQSPVASRCHGSGVRALRRGLCTGGLQARPPSSGTASVDPRPSARRSRPLPAPSARWRCACQSTAPHSSTTPSFTARLT